MRIRLNRNIVIAATVVVFHVAVLWALQNGLLRRTVEMVMPAEILTQIIEIEPPRIAAPPPTPLPPQPAKPVPKKATLPPPPSPVAIADPLPAQNAPAAVLERPPPAAPVAAPVAPDPAPPAPPAPPAAPQLVEVTQGETVYILPPRPVYPALSKRSGEAGVVMVAVYYSAAGHARRAEILKSSGFERLDRAAREAVLASQVTPFRRAGVSEDTEFLLKAPINFVLE